MFEEELIKYLTFFKKLNRGFNKELGKAPHKPLLLLSVIQLISNGLINTNRIFITPELVLAFKENWQKLVESNHSENFSLPFFHLRSEPFWNLVTKNHREMEVNKSKSIKSFKNLKESVAFAEIDKQLFFLIQDPTSRIVLENFLVDTYFSSTKSNYHTNLYSNLEGKINDELLNDDSKEYAQKIQELQNSLNEEQYEEEIFVRGGLFKKAIPKIYDYSCCISGMRIETSINSQMVDACHIKPFSISHDDTIPNGICLSPNLHRAFDRGLITINKDYVVRVSPIVDDNGSVYSITQFEGSTISFPEKPKWYPSPESLIWHTKEIFQL
jgi:putative restriction endonuclease